MAKLVKIRDPFTSEKRIVHIPDGTTVKEALERYVGRPGADTELVVSLNGKALPSERYPSAELRNDDILLVQPKIAGSVAAALSSIWKVVETIAQTAIPLLAKPGGLGAFLLRGALAYAGGLLVQSMYSVPDMKDQSSSEQTYSWGDISPDEGQGGSVQVTYGRIRTAGHVIASHVESIDEKQYLYLLLCGGEGPCSCSDFLINGNPVGNYDRVSVEYRGGNNGQTAISAFGDSFSDISIAYKLDLGSWAVQRGVGVGQGIAVTLEFPSGIYYVDDDSTICYTQVPVKAQYRQVGGEWREWFEVALIGMADRNPYRWTARLDNLPEATYEVRMKVVEPRPWYANPKEDWKRGRDQDHYWRRHDPADSSRYTKSCYWILFSHILYDDFTYPNRVVVGLKALATDQLSGSTPTLTWIQERSYVWVWNGTEYVQRAANNPAWACYDAIHACHDYGGVKVVKGVPADRMVYSAFEAWASFCDREGLKLNIMLDEEADLWEQIHSRMAPIGRGVIILRGTKYSCIWDEPSEEVQAFNVANTMKDSFSEEFLGREDRATCIDVNFTNADEDYSQDSIRVYGHGYDTSERPANPTTLTVRGITSYDQAYRHGWYHLQQNRYLVRTVSWMADIDSIACQVGDVVRLQHDVPQWGYGGRVVSASAGGVVLDKAVTVVPGKSYRILIRHSATDELEYESVENPAADTSMELAELSIRGAWDTVPGKDDLWIFGESEVVGKPYRITKIGRSRDLKREITGIEYVPEIYEGTEVPKREYSDLSTEIRNMICGTSFDAEYCRLNISFIPPTSYTGASVTVNGGKVADLGSSEHYVSVKAAPKTEYTVTVVAREGGRTVSKTAVYTTEDWPVPADVDGLYIDRTSDGRLKISWKYSDPPEDLAGFEIRKTYGAYLAWSWGEGIFSDLVPGSPAVADLPAGKQTIMVKAVSKHGKYSADPAYGTINIGDALSANLVYEYSCDGNGFPGTVDNYSVTDLSGSEGGVLFPSGIEEEDEGYILTADEKGTFFDTGDETHPMFLDDALAMYPDVEYMGMVYTSPEVFPDPESGMFSVAYSGQGTARIQYRAMYPNRMFGPDDTYMFTDDPAKFFSLSEWQDYKGPVEFHRDYYQVRVIFPSGHIQGIITDLSLIVDAPDMVLYFSDRAVSPAGLSLSATDLKGMNAVRNVNVTLQDDGGSAVSAKVLSKSADEVRIMTYDSSGLGTSGTVDVIVQGYK